MTGTKNKSLRKIATITASGLVLVALSAVLAINVFAEKPQHIETAEFLQSSFVEGKYIDGFTPGTPDYGFTLEAMAQLKYSGKSQSDQQAAVDELLLGDTSYLYNPETQEPILGLVGKYLYTSVVLDVANQEKVEELTAEVKQYISEKGELSNFYANTFDYSWLILGLHAVHERETATLLGNHLATLSREDGGFGFDQSEATISSSTDATGLAIQALTLLKANGEQSEKDLRQLAIDAGLSYLESTIVDGNHFVAYEAVDVNGTAYAAMAIKAATGEANEAIQAWLEAQKLEDGGITTPWTDGKSDVYATAQGYLPLEGKSYLDLIGR